MSASGEGNLSNLIKENAPDWYPTWLQALAIEEDDNPFEAAFKTALEGGMLGAPIGAATGYLRGARAVRKLQKANPKATPQELQQAAFEAIQGELFTSVPNVNNQNLPAADVAREFRTETLAVSTTSLTTLSVSVNQGYDVTAPG